VKRVKPRRIISILTLSALSILLISTEVWAGPATAWSQRTLDITIATCMTRSVNALRAAGFKDIQRDPNAVAASDGPASAWIICYSVATRRTLVTIFTAADELNDATRMRTRLRDFVVSGGR
jgi:hypothetical protein